MSELKLSWMKKGEDREWLSAVGVRESPGQSCVPRLAQPDLTLKTLDGFPEGVGPWSRASRGGETGLCSRMRGRAAIAEVDPLSLRVILNLFADRQRRGNEARKGEHS